MQEKLLTLFADQKIAQKGHFKMESGYHGDLGLNLDLLFLKPSRIRPFAEELALRFDMYKIEAVCGPLTGGAIIAEMIASTLDIEFYSSERFENPQGTCTLYSYGYQIPKTLYQKAQGKKFAIVDDVINAGSVVRGTFQNLLSCGAIPVTIGALLITGSKALEYFADKNISLEKIAYLDNNLWTPSECPLCASHKPRCHIDCCVAMGDRNKVYPLAVLAGSILPQRTSSLSQRGSAYAVLHDSQAS